MFLNWVKRNAAKLTATENANFHILSPDYEDKFLKAFKTTEDEFEAKVLLDRRIGVALLFLWNSRNFEVNSVNTADGKVNGIEKLEVIRHDEYKITLISGFLSKPHLNKFIKYLLSGGPEDTEINFMLKRMMTSRAPIFIPSVENQSKLEGMTSEQLEEVFLRKPDYPIEVDEKTLTVLFPTGERIGYVWAKQNIYHLAKIPDFYSDRIFNVKTRTPPKPAFVYVEGPVSLTEWSRKDLHMYLFGDVHVKKLLCRAGVQIKMTIVNVINDAIVSNPNKIIDVYLEHPFANKHKKYNEYRDNSYLSKVNTAFGDCLLANKSKCPYKNVRFHYVDIRDLGLLNSTRGIISRFYEGPVEVSEIAEFELLWNKFRLAIPGKQVFDEILEQTKIRKQFDAVTDKNVVQKIKDHFMPWVERDLANMMHQWIRATVSSPEEKAKIYSSLCRNIISWGALWQDLYTLGRLFRSYKPSKSGITNADARYVIMYLGNAHVDRLNAFMGYVRGFVQGERSESEDQKSNFQCLKVSAKLPLFKYD